jgi:branched-chain amino acid transport system permease protein
MTAELFLQLFLNGLAIGMTYVLVASGLILLLGVVRIFNFAHGEFYMLGAYVTFGCVELLHLNFFLSILIGIAAVTLLSWLAYRLIFHHIRGDILLCTAASIGLSMMLMRGALLGFGSQERGLRSPFGGNLGLAGVRLPTERVAVILLCLVVMFALYVLLMKTKLGKAMRAVAQDTEASAMMGIDVNRTISVTFFIAGSLAAAAGLVYLLQFNMRYDTGFELGLIAFTAAVLGGIGNLPGAVLGAMVIGLIQAYNEGLDGTPGGDWTRTIVFGILIATLVFRPEGLLGERTPEGA